MLESEKAELLRHVDALRSALLAIPTRAPLFEEPLLVTPKVWKPTETDRRLRYLAADQDVVVDCTHNPAIPLGIEINGGRNIVLRGSLQPLAKTTSAMVRINGNADADRAPRKVHFDRFAVKGQHVWEGINIDSKAETKLTVQIKDFVIDQVNVDKGVELGSHIGGDALQCWAGPHSLLIDGFWAKALRYQGLMLQPYKFGPHSLGAPMGRYAIRNMLLEGHREGSAYLLWWAHENFNVELENVRVRSYSKSREQTIWRSGAHWKDAVFELVA